MDLIDLANLKIFGNTHFRPKQKEIIKAALQVGCLVTHHVYWFAISFVRSALTAPWQT